MTEALEQYLEDWEDYMDAVRICAEVDAGRMATYSREAINREMDARSKIAAPIFRREPIL